MKYKIKFPLKKASDEWSLTGKYFIVDGQLYIEMGSENNMGLHAEMFQKIKKLKPEYKDYHYLYIPRGAVLFDSESGLSLISGPAELTTEQRRRIGRSFNTKKIEWMPDVHYNWSYIERYIRKANEAMHYDDDIIEEEVEFLKAKFNEQLEMFTGTEEAIFI